MNGNGYNPYGYGSGMPYPWQNPYSMPSAGYQNTGAQPVQQTGMPTVMQVSTIKQVEQVTVQPGSKVLVLVANDPVIAMRSADGMGLTTTDYYHIERFDPDAKPAGAEYVTRAEFQQFVESLRASAAPQANGTEVSDK